MAPAAIVALISGALATWKIIKDKSVQEASISPAPLSPRPSTTAFMPQPQPGSEDAATIKAIITEEARKQGLNPNIALLFAFLESRFENKLGDSRWPFLKDKYGRSNWEKAVLNSEKLKYNPHVDQKELWISYGPFQILSAYHLHKINPNASPMILSDIRTNIALGVQIIKNLQRTYNGDLRKMRLAYVCGIISPSAPVGSCAQETANSHLSLLVQHAPKFGLYA